jgi:hypothetical protein
VKNSNNEWLKDYEEFIKTEQPEVPREVGQNVYSKIAGLLNPSAMIVFFKILGLHLVTGFVSLSICHQFGLNPFNTQYSLANWFMKVGGHHFCMFGCGILFVSVGLFSAGYFLTVEEIKALKRTDFLQNLSLGLISLGLFTAFGAEMVLNIAGLWLLGGLIGGFVATTIIGKIRLA